MSEEAEEKDNPAKNYALTLYLKAFPKDCDKEPTLADWDEAFHTLTTVAEELNISAFVGQAERGEGGTQHGQAYAQLTKKQRKSTLAKNIRKFTPFTAHVSNARGSAEQNVAYCTKTTGPWVYANGTMKHSTTLSKQPVWIGKERLKKKGQRSDISEAVRAIQNGSTIRELWERFPNTMIRYHRGFTAMKYSKNAEDLKGERLGYLLILYGPAGTGKSWHARNTFTELWGLTKTDVYSPNFDGSQVWFDGYNGEKVLLIDDYERGSIKRGQLLRMTDIYAYHAAIKGGHVVAAWDYVIITTNESFEEMFGHIEIENDPDYGRIENFVSWDAMYSRVNEAITFEGMPDRRAQLKGFSKKSMVEVLSGEAAESVAPLLPATLEHGTVEDCALVQSGVRGSIPRLDEPPVQDDSTLEHFAKLGTNPSRILSFKRIEDGLFKEVKPSESDS